MEMNTAVRTSTIVVRSRADVRESLTPLAFLLGAVVYPLAPPVLYALAQAPLAAAMRILALAAGTALVFTVPIAGIALVWASRGINDLRALRQRFVGMLLVVTPVLTALATTWAGAIGLPARVTLPLWVGAWALTAAAVAWRSAAARPLLSASTNRRARRLHRTLVILLLLFAGAHLAVNLTAVWGLATYDQAAAWFRLAWRTPVGEPVLIAILALQAGTGMMLAADAALGRSTFEHLCQITAGLFIAAFLTSHTFAVAVLGRTLLDRGPAFTFASAGPAGLLGSAQAVVLLPYYALGVLALFVHLARPLRVSLTRRAGAMWPRVAAGTLVIAGFVISGLLLVALVNPTR